MWTDISLYNYVSKLCLYSKTEIRVTVKNDKRRTETGSPLEESCDTL